GALNGVANVYQAPVEPLLSGSNQAAIKDAITLGQGAGFLGGLGVLVDTSGNDRYTATAPPIPPTTPPKIATIAQGTGALGTGLLFDLGGNDVYTARGPTTGGAILSGVFAQGDGQYDAGGGCAVFQGACSSGSLFDLGGGNDMY